MGMIKRQLISLLLSSFAAVLLMGPGRPGETTLSAAGAEPPATLTLGVPTAQRPILAIQPGFTLVIIFPVPIEFVAVGDDALLAIAVRAPSGVVALKATQRTGRTNMHIQAGGVVTVFEIRINPAGRTADVVRIVIDGAGSPTRVHPAPVSGSPLGSSTAPPPPASFPTQPPSAAEAETRGASTTSSASPAVSTLFRTQEVFEQGIRATFQAYRTASGIEIRYELANSSDLRWKLAPRRVLVRADGQIIVARVADAPDGAPHDTLGNGATRHGRLVVSQRAETIEILFPLFPVGMGPHQVPVQLTVRFSNLESLAERHP